MRRFIIIGTFLMVLFAFSRHTYFTTYNPSEADLHGVDFEFKGVNLVAPIRELRERLPDELDSINVNAIALNPYAFVNLEEGTVSYNNEQQWWGEKTEGIRICAQELHSTGFRLMLKPHLWVNHQMYTGDLKFSTEEAWTTFEREYEEYVMDFARLAEEQGIEVFCIGTELKEAIAIRPEYWSRLIRDIRGVYHGKLTYAANWDEYANVPFWDSLDYIGIDAYFPLSGSDTPGVERLKRSWKSCISDMDIFRRKYKKNILFTEFGYRNANRCAHEPWKEDNEIANNQAQVNAYEALFQSVAGKSWFAGGFAWKWYSDDYYKDGMSIDYTPQEKPALGVLEKWYR